MSPGITAQIRGTRDKGQRGLPHRVKEQGTRGIRQGIREKGGGITAQGQRAGLGLPHRDKEYGIMDANGFSKG